MPAARRSEPTAFVLAGGGSLGAVQAGMLHALHGGGIVPDFLVGSSVGALNAAHFAGRPDAAGIRALEQIWLGLRRADVFPFSLWGGFLRFLTKRSYIVRPDALRAVIDQALSFDDLGDARIPCHVTATDLLEGTAVVLSRGPASEALMASAAVPAIFPPVQISGRLLIDGGVASNTPIATAVRLGARRIIVLPTGFSCALDRPPRGTIEMALHALNLLVMRQLVDDTERYADRARIAVVPPICPLAISAYDFSRTAELIQRAKTSTKRWLADGGLDKAAGALPHNEHPDRLTAVCPRKAMANAALPQDEVAV
ncbi:MAG TPA: patatin-like phospholipase family protein [Nevskiaceae bacterium]|nr:patatin-like phospholipase family protein [Nevskiaceae bacterium]